MKKILALILLILIFHQFEGFSQWENLLNKRYFPILKTVWNIEIDPINTNSILMGCCTQLFYSSDYGDSWKEIIHPLKPESGLLRRIGVYKNYFFIAQELDKFFVSSDYGNTWEKCAQPYWKYEGAHGIDSICNSEYFDIKFHEDKVYLAGGVGPFVSYNFGKSWEPLFGPDYPRPDAPGPTTTRSILIKDNAIFIGSHRGVQVTRDHGKSWEYINNGIQTDNRLFDIISIISLDTLLFAVSDDHEKAYVSKDDGLNWEEIFDYERDISNKTRHSFPEGKLFTCNDILYFPIYVTLVIYSKDYGKTWNAIVPGYNPGDMMSYNMNEKYIYVGNNGQGLWRAPISNCEIVTNSVLEPVKDNITLSITPNPANERAEIVYYLDQPAHVSLSLQGLLGESIIQLEKNTYKNTGRHSIEINTSNIPSGVYYILLNTDNKFTTRKISIVK